ncbi:MAG: cupin domain-containing protein [Clostridia bacterium]|nr:cupin domain-containing protein [Clostridia bacterium]
MDYPARFHKHLEIAFVEEGVLDVTIDNQTFELNKGDLYVVFPNLLHSS